MTSLEPTLMPDSRPAREIRCYDFLDTLGITYTRIDHAPAMTMENCRGIDIQLGCRMCKNLLLCNRQKTAFYLLLMPAEKPFRTAEFSKRIGSSRLSFASGQDMERLLDTLPGSLSLLSLMNDKDGAVRLFCDNDLLSADRIGLHPCNNTSSLALSVRDALTRLPREMGHEITFVTLTGEGDELS